MLLTAAPLVSTQIAGPTPLSWRWVQPTNIQISGAPTVKDDMVYMAVGPRLFALDLATGNEKWKYPRVDPLQGLAKTSPTLVGEVLVFSTDQRLLYGINAKTGEHLWMTRTDPKSSIGEAVALSENQFALAFTDESLQTFDAKTGQPSGVGVTVEGGIVGQISAHGANIIAITNNSEMVSISGLTGKTNWRARFNSIPAGTKPVLKGEMLYVNSGPYLVCVNAATGRLRWQQPFEDQIAFGPAVSATNILAMGRDGKGMVYDLNGRRQLRDLVQIDSFPSALPSAVGDMFLVPTANGGLNLIDPKTGKVTWTFVIRPLRAGTPTRGARPANQQVARAVSAAGPAVLAGGTMVVMARDGSLLAFNPQSGVDLTAPTVKMVWPPSGALVSGQPPLEFIFTTEDLGTGLKTDSVSIEMDGKPMDFTLDENGIAFATISLYGGNKPLMDGRKVVTVKAQDWMGNEASKSYAVVIDNSLPPLRKPTGTPQAPAAGSGGGSGGPRGSAGGGG
jgi:outer membrane protein assembly factor BamB